MRTLTQLINELGAILENVNTAAITIDEVERDEYRELWEDVEYALDEQFEGWEHNVKHEKSEGQYWLIANATSLHDEYEDELEEEEEEDHED